MYQLTRVPDQMPGMRHSTRTKRASFRAEYVRHHRRPRGEPADVWGPRLHTIFIGGGHASSFRRGDRRRQRRWHALMVDPDTATMKPIPAPSRSSAFAAIARGREPVSVGVPSFDEARLPAIGQGAWRRSDAARAADGAGIFPRVNATPVCIAREDLEGASPDILEAAPRRPPTPAYPTPRRARHPLPPLPPQATRRRHGGDMQERSEPLAGGQRATPLRDPAFAKLRPSRAPTPSTTDLRGYLGHRAAGPLQDLVRDTPRCASNATASPRNLPRGPALGKPLQERATCRLRLPSRVHTECAVGFTPGFPVALFAQRTGLAITAMTANLPR